MKYHFRKIIMIIKTIILCISVAVTLYFTALPASFQLEKQTYDMKSSIMISLGFGTAICLVLNNRKKE